MTAAPAVRIPDPVTAVLEEARWWLERPVHEEPAGSNRGVVVDFANYYALPVWKPYPEGMQGAPWCASSVHLVGRSALGRGWPVPRTPGCQAIADWAAQKTVLLIHPDPPMIGDLFLLYYTRLRRYGHVGFVSGIAGGMIETIEGNTGNGGTREGWGMFARRRRITEHVAFVRWWRAL